MFYALEFFYLYQCVFFNDKSISLITACAKFVLLDILIWNIIIQILVIPKLIFYHSFIYGSLYVTLCFVLCPFDFGVFVC